MASTMVRVAVVAMLLMRCCIVIVAARPLLHGAAAADGRGRQLGQAAAAGAQLAAQQVLGQKKMSRRPGEGNPTDWVGVNHGNTHTPVGLGVAHPATP
ncbi:hypothetical protein SEVIR_9G534533v4 [Setaria viridis]|uniref:Uncharacterized protein n=1 Tax=Setaria viridis TaxID=4556 RepID=A0A4U6TB34_SETVI|nr:hypothetical protein SEVIR_9G534533v2 [Setaria viridis]